jgi:hypothetical protein
MGRQCYHAYDHFWGGIHQTELMRYREVAGPIGLRTSAYTR